MINVNHNELLIDEQVKAIKTSGIRQFFNRVSTVEGAVQLTLGQPDFPTPDHVKKSAIKAIEEGATTYTPNQGIEPLRIAAADFVKEKYGLSYNAKSEVITTVGASQALDLAVRTLITTDDEVIIPAPVYPAYEPLITLKGGKPVFVDTRETNFTLTANALREAITSKTKAVILPYPSNPTGVMLEEAELQEIVDVLREHPNVFVISDEIYSELVYEGFHRSIATIGEMRERTFVINGVSKSHSMTGWRIGFLFGPESLIQHALKVHQYNVSCPTSISQYAALAALTNGKDDANAMKDAYVVRRNYVMERLDAMGISYTLPKGAFYLFPSIEKTGLTSFDFAVTLLEQEKLAVVPGTAFSDYGEGYVRLSYAYSMDNLKEACDRLERFIQSL
ncbi:aminotransferase A [Geomicrobium sp. JCM 19055]|uniref:aminotransferase A n=1 Tax=Geomicrobium sp. JCM 19055 TaxID=1460649 RepID=UPI0005AB03A4